MILLQEAHQLFATGYETSRAMWSVPRSSVTKTTEELLLMHDEEKRVKGSEGKEVTKLYRKYISTCTESMVCYLQQTPLYKSDSDSPLKVF